jgi:hypothetical protein
MVRISRDRDLPRHFDGSPLASWVHYVGWPSAGILCAGGIWLVVGAASKPQEFLGALVALAGVVVAAALVRCRRYEVTIGQRTITLCCGPFRQTLPVGSIEVVQARGATGWRRLYADRELVLETSLDRGPMPVPTRDEAELRGALVRTLER